MKQFEKVYQDNAKIVYGFLLKKSHNKEIAEDLMQETFLIAYKKLETFDYTSKMSTWLCGIANNLWLKSLKQRESNLLGYEIVDYDQYDWETVDVLKHVHNLKDPYKEVIYLRISGNLSFAQIGAILNKSENWARVTFYRGKQQLKEAMKDEIFL